MKPRPTIFLSGVSREFSAFRDAAEVELQKKGCFAENQSSFAPDHRTVEEMLTRRIEQSDAVILLVGFRFGAEPEGRPVGAPRRSYAQMEFDIARRLNKPVYVFLSQTPQVRQWPNDDGPPEDDEAQRLQLAHREAVTTTTHLYYYFDDLAQLCRLVAAVPVVATAGFRADVGRLDHYAPAELVGRENELALLTGAWDRVCRAERPRPHVLTLVALGGEGKTSLVASWMASLAADGWRGCDAAFAWSFYSQGTTDQGAASGDLFLAEALRFFGDAATADSPMMAADKGKRLAELVGARRALLILDGLEPLQHPPIPPLAGQLKDPGVSALLKALAARSDGLCVVTTRYSIADLKNYRQTTAPETQLLRLSNLAGVGLLRRLGVVGAKAAMERLVEDVKGHALTLTLMGSYLHHAHAGDVRKRDLVKLGEADEEEQGGHAFRVMDAYATWLEGGGDKGRRALALLSLVGLFDRPATADCLAALQKPPLLPALTDVAGMTEAQRNAALAWLEKAQLVTVNRGAGETLLSLDAHPLLREYFARRLCADRPVAFRAAHVVLCEHLCATTQDKKQRPTLDDLQPLYQAVAHGCLAKMHQEVANEIFFPRLRRHDEHYTPNKLGAYGAELSALANFFDRPWTHVSPVLPDDLRAWMLAEAASTLQALGRSKEALEPMQLGLQMRIEQRLWKNAAIVAGNLSELELTLGDVAAAEDYAELSIYYADLSGCSRMRVGKRVRLAHALHQAGKRALAQKHFRQAETMQAGGSPDDPLLYAPRGYHYCDLLLATAEAAAWRPGASGPAADERVRICHDVERRARLTLKGMASQGLLLHMAHDHLTLGCASLYAWILCGMPGSVGGGAATRARLDDAVNGLRRAGRQDQIPRALLSRAWVSCLLAEAHRGSGEFRQATECNARSVADLNEAWEIAEREPMPLHLADVHLYRCRLFHAAPVYPWSRDSDGRPRGPKDDLADARRLIERCGYWRRKEELEDAEAVSVNWPGAQS